MLKKISAVVSSGIFILINPLQAFAATNSIDCTSRATDSYFCVSSFGYTGTDPYNVDRFVLPGPDGHKHSCTSFAAYTLAMFNPPMPAISHFNAARSWAVDALKVGATVGHVPHPGDIAQWGKPSDLSEGHVAYVQEIKLDTFGNVNAIVISEDNGGLRITRRKTIYLSDTTTTSNYLYWPDNFISFPVYTGGGGGRPPVALISTPGNN